MKVAIIHDWLIKQRGGEKVLEHLLNLYPEADLYTLFYRKQHLSEKFKSRRIHGSLIQGLPYVEKYYQFLLPLFPLLTWLLSFQLKNYDLIVSSSHCTAKAVKGGKETLHLSYCHTPMRYAWKFQKEYFKGRLYGPLANLILGWLKKWDAKTASRVDFFCANSKEVQERIKKFYHREAHVIHPPLDLSSAQECNESREYFLVVSALVPYKRIDLAVDACNKLGLPLKIIGTGPCLKDLKKKAGKTIEFLGWVDEASLKTHYKRAIAFLFPGLEDFGITPLEAQAQGTPVIAYGKGGAVETVIPYKNNPQDFYSGIFFYEQTTEALIEAVKQCQKLTFHRKSIINYTSKFRAERFESEFRDWAHKKIQGFQECRLQPELIQEKK